MGNDPKEPDHQGHDAPIDEPPEAPPFAPDLDLIGDLERGQQAALETRVG